MEQPKQTSSRGKRSLRLSPEGKQKVEDALLDEGLSTSEELAEKAGMSRSTADNFRKGESVDRRSFLALCTVLGLNWRDVVEGEDAEPVNEPTPSAGFSNAVSTQFASASRSFEQWVAEVRSRTCQKTLYQHGTIQLLNQAEIEVDQLYVDVWLLDRSPRTFQVSESTLLKSFDLRSDRLGLGDRIKRNEGMEIANKNSKLLILGKPGAGKTTFLKHLAVDCSKGKFQADLIPVLIELRRIRSDEWKLLDAISEGLKLNNQETQTLLEQGKLLILMDGLDEVPTSDFRRTVQDQVRSLTQEPKHSGNRFILTCRTQIVEVIPQGFTSVEVADFNKEQVKKFVENWFCASGLTEAKITQQWQRFADAIAKNPALKELTITPVLLSLMCLVLQDEGDLPTQAALLYRKGIRLLLEKWNDRKDIRGWEVGDEVYWELELEQKEALLIEIAAQKFENPRNFVLFEQKDLAKQIAHFLDLANLQEGEAVLKAIEAHHGLLVERADELWSFSHLTFQEYFTAQWLNQLQRDAGLAEKIVDKRWQEVVKLAVKSQQPADKLLRLIKQAIDYSISTNAKLQELLVWIQFKAQSIQTNYKAAAIRATYFAFEFDLPCNFSLDHALEFALDHAFEFTPDSTLKLAIDLTLAHTLALIRVLDPALNFDLDPAPDLHLDHALTRARSRAYVLDPMLADRLEELRTQLLRCFDQNRDSWKQWWKYSGQAWSVELRQVAIEYCNVGHDWQFTETQRQAIQRYYDSNKFLIQLLKEPGAISERTRQEIEDNLLLPISTLRERQPDLYGNRAD